MKPTIETHGHLLSPVVREALARREPGAQLAATIELDALEKRLAAGSVEDLVAELNGKAAPAASADDELLRELNGTGVAR